MIIPLFNFDRPLQNRMESNPMARSVHTNDPVRPFNGQCSSVLNAVARLETRSILTVNPSLWLNDDTHSGEWKREQNWQKRATHDLWCQEESKCWDVRKELNDVKTSYFSTVTASLLYGFVQNDVLCCQQLHNINYNIKSFSHWESELSVRLGLGFNARNYCSFNSF